MRAPPNASESGSPRLPELISKIQTTTKALILHTYGLVLVDLRPTQAHHSN
jgi:hypothetical protein